MNLGSDYLNRDYDLSETSQQDTSDEYALDPSTVFLLPPRESEPPPSYGAATRIVELQASSSRLPKEKGRECRSGHYGKYMGKAPSEINSCLSTSTVDA